MGPRSSCIEHDPLPAELSDRFDVVGYRSSRCGTQQSDQLPQQCATDVRRGPDDGERGRSFSLPLGQPCIRRRVSRRKYGAVLPYLGTRNVARDMDEVRKALGDDKLNYLGYSYGTSIGEEYADLFPDPRSGDGARRRRQQRTDRTAARPTGQADGFERALHSFLDDCASTTAAAGSTGFAGAVVDRVAAAAEQQPIPAPDADRPAGPRRGQLGLGQGAVLRAAVARSGVALADAARGDGSGLVDLADGYLNAGPMARTRTFRGLLRRQLPRQHVAQRHRTASSPRPRQCGKLRPAFGEASSTTTSAARSGRPGPSRSEAVPRQGLPPILVDQHHGRPGHALRVRRRGREATPAGVLITNVATATPSSAAASSASTTRSSKYLVDLTPPQNGLRCS